MHALIFVFGTLKEGFPNFPANRGSRVPGRFRTENRYPLYLIGERHSPWMLDLPGVGFQVVGELYEVDGAALAGMDLLERVTEPDGYVRKEMAVRPEGTAHSGPIFVQAYLKRAELFDPALARLGPIPEYLPAHAALYRSRTA